MPDNKHVNNPAYELEKEALRDEIQLGLEKGVGRLTKKADRFVEPDHFHNTKHLLKQYRRIAYGVRMAESEMNLRMELEHGVSLATTEANAELAGIDLSDTKLERHAKTVIRSRRMLAIIRAALDCVKEDPDRGDLLYAVLYQTYFTERKPKNREEVIFALEKQGFEMSSPSYYNYLRQAIRAIDKILWGYTARDCIEIIKQFLPE